MSSATERIFEELSYTLETRPNDLDVLGHVNNAVVLELLEAGRWDWARRNGVLQAGRVVVVVSRIEVDYRQQILPGRVILRTRLTNEDLAPEWRDESNYRAVVEQTIWSAAHAFEPGLSEQAGQPDDIACSTVGRELVRARVSLAFIDRQTKALSTLQDCLQGS